MSTLLTAPVFSSHPGGNSKERLEDFTTWDIKQLREENLRLQEELAQCQVDKEFVWSLWKKLQVASPDLTEAISLVIERERQKTEEKDRKVLEILQIKDRKIGELQETVNNQSREIEFLTHKKLEILEDLSRQQTENSKLREDLQDVKTQLSTYSAHDAKTNAALQKTLDEASNTCQRLQAELNLALGDKERLHVLCSDQEKILEALQRENANFRESHDKKHSREQQLVKLVKKYEHELNASQLQVKSKSKELEMSRKELADLWDAQRRAEINMQQRESIIRQLEELQTNTEHVLKENELAYQQHLDQQHKNLSDELATGKRREMSLEAKIKDLGLRVDHYERLLKDRELKTDHIELVNREGVCEEKWRTRLYNMERENEALREKLCDKNRVIDRLSKQTDYDYIEQTGIDERRKHSRSRSESGLPLKHAELLSNYKQAIGKLEQTQLKLQLKENQLSALQHAHKRRLARLKSLLTSYKLVRQQLKTCEDELGRPPKKAAKMLRPSQRQLRKEDPEAAWNELRYVNNENKNLHVIRMNLEEKLDDMAVKMSEDASTIHELQAQLSQLQEELAIARSHGKRGPSTPHKNQEEETARLKAEVLRSETLAKNLQQRLKETLVEKNVLVEEKRSLKFEMNDLKKSLFDQKTVMTDLRAEISSLRQAVKMAKSSTQPSQSAIMSPIAKRYQDALNRSVHEISASLRVPQSAEKYPQPSDNRSECLSNHSELNSETLSELAGCSESGYSLGEEIVNKASEERTLKQLIGDSGARHSKNRPVRRSTKRRSVKDSATSPLRRIGQEHHLGLEKHPRQGRQHPRAVTRKILSWRTPGQRLNRGNHYYLQVSSLRQRLVSLELKAASAVRARDQAIGEIEEQRRLSDEQKAELDMAKNKLTSHKITIEQLERELQMYRHKINTLETAAEEDTPRKLAIQQLTSQEQTLKNNIESQRSMIDHLERQLVTSQQKVDSLEIAAADCISRVQAEQERKSLENRIKSLLSDLANKSTSLKETKAELDSLKESNTDIKDKMNRLERDVVQKRTLLEDLRLKLRLTQENAKSDMQTLEAKSDEMSRMKAVVEQNKATIDSLKVSVHALTKEKRDYEAMYSETSSALNQREKQLAKSQAQCKTLQADLDELQAAARQQMIALAAQGENAVTFAQEKLSKSHALIQEYQKFVQNLSAAMMARIIAYRCAKQKLMRKKKLKKKAENESNSLRLAKKRAQEILNLSASDVDNILNEGDTESDEAGDDVLWEMEERMWTNQLEDALRNEDFGRRLADMFSDKMDTLVNLR